MSFYDIVGFLSFVTLVFLGVFALIRDGVTVKEVFECEADQLEKILQEQEKRINERFDRLEQRLDGLIDVAREANEVNDKKNLQ